jgi:hypothetical protein
MIVENHRFLQYFPLKTRFVYQKINPYVNASFSNNPINENFQIKKTNSTNQIQLTSTKFFKCPR